MSKRTLITTEEEHTNGKEVHNMSKIRWKHRHIEWKAKMKEINNDEACWTRTKW